MAANRGAAGAGSGRGARKAGRGIFLNGDPPTARPYLERASPPRPGERQRPPQSGRGVRRTGQVFRGEERGAGSASARSRRGARRGPPQSPPEVAVIRLESIGSDHPRSRESVSSADSEDLSCRRHESDAPSTLFCRQGGIAMRRVLRFGMCLLVALNASVFVAEAQPTAAACGATSKTTRVACCPVSRSPQPAPT